MNQGALKLEQYLCDHETTAAELAGKCGMFPAQLCHLQKGRRIPTLSQALELNRHARIPLASWLQQRHVGQSS